MASRSASGITAPRPSILSSSSDHCLRVMCCSVMRLALWQEVQAPFTLACIGPGGSGLPGALGACALAGIMDASRKIAGKTRWIKQDPFLSSQFSVLSSQFSGLDVFRVLWLLFLRFSLRISGCYANKLFPWHYCCVGREGRYDLRRGQGACWNLLHLPALLRHLLICPCSVDVVIVNGRVEHA